MFLESTLAGHLGVKAGAIDARHVEKLEKELLQAGLGKEKRFSWLIDKTNAERQRGCTLSLSRFFIETPTRIITIFVVPGSRKGIRAAFPGIAQADVGVLVVDASLGEFEKGIAKDGVTLEHALLAYTFGVKELLVVVNKMDGSNVRFAQSRFDEIKQDVVKALRKVGYAQHAVTVIPCSALLGDNISSPSEHTPYHAQGPQLLSWLTERPIPRRQIHRPLRMSVRSVMRPAVAAGRIEQGTIRVGQAVVLAPRMVATVVESIHMRQEQVDVAYAGDIVGVVLRDVDSADLNQADVIGPVEASPQRCAQFVARLVVTMNHPSQIKAGYCPVLVCHTAAVPCRVTKILSKTDKAKKSVSLLPEFLGPGEHGEVLMVPLKPLSLETFESCPSLGRFALRDMGVTVAVGFIQVCTFDASTKVLVLREKMERLQVSKKNKG